MATMDVEIGGDGVGRHPHCSRIKLTHLEESGGRVSTRILWCGALRPFLEFWADGFLRDCVAVVLDMSMVQN
ncbi:hypothetical protein ACFX2I_037464 [Malus domestica]